MTSNPPGSMVLVLLLSVMGLLNSFGSDMLLPALPQIGSNLSASPWETQQVVSLFFLTCALMSLWHGALADAWGRRRVIIGALLVLMLAALASAYCSDIRQLWILRAIQGMAAAAGMVVSRAIVRDRYDGLAVQHLLSRISLLQTIAFVLVPILGALITVAWGWRALFLTFAGICLVIIVIYWRWLPETLPGARRQPLRPMALVRSYLGVLGSASFMRLTAAHVANWVSMVAYVVAAPVLVMRHLGLDATHIYLVFGPLALGMVFGFWLFARIAGRHGPEGTLMLAYGILGVGTLLNVGLAIALPPGLIHFLPLFVYAIGMPIAVPLLLGLGLEPMGNRAGVASSCQMFLQHGTSALVAGLLVPLLCDSLAHLALGVACLTAAGTISLLRERQAIRHAVTAPA